MIPIDFKIENARNANWHLTIHLEYDFSVLIQAYLDHSFDFQCSNFKFKDISVNFIFAQWQRQRRSDADNFKVKNRIRFRPKWCSKERWELKPVLQKIYKTYQNGIRSHLWTHIFPTKELSAKNIVCEWNEISNSSKGAMEISNKSLCCSSLLVGSFNRIISLDLHFVDSVVFRVKRHKI